MTILKLNGLDIATDAKKRGFEIISNIFHFTEEGKIIFTESIPIRIAEKG